MNELRILLSLIREKASLRRSFLPALAVAMVFIMLPASSTLLDTNSSTSVIPLIEILSVSQDVSVDIRAHNFPANIDFTATMGPMGTQGVNGIVVGNGNSGNGGSFDISFNIPQELIGSRQISIRLQSPGSFPYYSYNWFFNNTTGGTAPETVTPVQQPATTGIPTFKVTAVEQNVSASIQTNNFPANQAFTVTMGPMGTRGIDGIVVGTLDSGSGGSLTASYPMPTELHGMSQISIRAQTAQAQPYFAYNWFWNNDANAETTSSSTSSSTSSATSSSSSAASSTGTGGQPESTTQSAGASSSAGAYTGIPVMTITSVVRDQSVTFQTHNYPPNQNFSVTMGPMGTQGINGIVVGSFESGDGGSFPVTMSIPTELAGSRQISIRAQTAGTYPYFSYNWFFNNSTQ